MHNKKTITPLQSSFRQRAEEDVKKKGHSANLSEVDVRALCHELEVHQIELEMQNEELKRVQMELAASKEEYQDLYEFAPIGYLTLEGSGNILKANLAAAALLGTERAHLANNQFQAYLEGNSVSEFKAFCRRMMGSDVKQTAELQLRGARNDNHASAWILVVGKSIHNDAGYGFWIALSDIADRKRAEEALLESEDKFRLVADFTYDWEVWLGTKGNYVYVSPSCERITGHSAEEFMKNPRLALDIVHPDDKATFERHRNNHLSEKFGSGKVDFRIITTNGETRWISHLCQPVFGKNGEWLGRRGSNRDITERKLMEEELRESKANLEAVFSSMNDGVIIFGADGKVTSANSAAAKFHRFTDKNDFLMGLNVYAQTFETRNLDRTQIIPHAWPVARALRGEVVFNQEIVVTRRETGETWIGNYSAAPIRDEKGKVVSAVVTMRDVTERKRIEEELRRSKDELEQRVQERTAELEEANKALYSSEQRLLLAQKAGGVGAYDWDIITGEFFCTPVLEKIYSMPAPTDNKVSYDVWLSCVPPEDRPGMQKKMQQIFESEVSELESEYRIIRPDGQERWIASRSLVIRDFDNRPLRIIGTNIDITERKVIENELRNAKEAAEAAAEIKAAFMANMSHELRTPMNYIVGMTSLLLEEPLTPELKEYIETIRKGGDEMMALINDILDFTKMESDNVVLEYQPLRLRALVEESLKMVASQAAEKGLNLAFNINYGTPDNIVSDHGRLRQVLISLLSNAVKFTDEGDISLSVSSEPLQKINKHLILFAVKDTGIGIPPEKMSELFQPFAQVETALSRKRDGVGLGLATSKKLVELMGGEVWVKSEIGKGSTFYFTVEVEIIPDDGIKVKPEGTTKAIPEKLAEQCPLRILIAEDIPSNQKVLLEMLKRMGYRADAVADGRELLEALENRPYDLVFMDVKMPEMDGIKATQEIRKRWPDNGPKIVAITAYALHGDKEKCLEAGMDDYISKPVQKDELAKVLAKYR